MANDAIVLSPECVGKYRREAKADGAIDTGAFLQYTATGVDVATAAVALGPKLIAVENISTAEGIAFQYAANENVFIQSLPGGTLVNAKVVNATYAKGDVLEVGANGFLTALAAGVAVAVVPSFGGATIGAGEHLIVELI